LQAFVNKYGPQNLEFSIVELCDKLSLQEREQFHIDAFDAYKQGFNTAPTATNTTGYKFTEEQRKNVSNGLKNSEKMRRARLVTQPYQTKILQEWCKNHQAELRTHMLTVIKEYRSKPVRCLNDGKIYESAREAARVLGLPHSSVPKVTNGIMSQTHGYRFEYVKSKTEDAELMAQ
jgi:group I intron endonuclease